MLVTVGIPTYRRMVFLQEAVESALDQNFDDYEILISQNPHPDSSLADPIEKWCRELAAKHPRIRYRKNSFNVGASENLNAIADDARGEFVLLIGDDDRLHPQCLSKLSEFVTDGADVVFANHCIIDSDGAMDQSATEELEQRFGRTALEAGMLTTSLAEKAAWSVSVAIAAALVRTTVLREYRFHPKLIKGDTEFFIRLASATRKFVFCKERVSDVRHHSDRASESVVGFSDLALALTDVTVSPALLAKKQFAMEVLTRQGVSDALLQGQIDVARKLIANPYYRRRHVKSFFQIFCANILPGKSGVRVFRRGYDLYRFRTNVEDANELGLEVQRDQNPNGKVLV